MNDTPDNTDEVREAFNNAEDIHVQDISPAPPDESAGEAGGDVEPKGKINKLAKKLSTLDQNDTGNGKRLLAHFGDDMCYVRFAGWHGWTGALWDPENGNDMAERNAQEVVQRIKIEAQYLKFSAKEQKLMDRAVEEEDADAKKAVESALEKRKAKRFGFAITSGNSARTSAMLSQARPHKTVKIDDLDQDAMLLNVENGTLVMSVEVAEKIEGCSDISNKTASISMKPHDRRDLISKVAAVTYDPKAKRPQWMEFLDRFQPDKEIQKFLQVFHGYALTGAAGEQKFIYNYGRGGNGKSIFVETIGDLMGTYRCTVNPESISGQGQRQGHQASPDIARMVDKRFVTVEELPRGEPLKENLIKALTGGGGAFTARHLNEGFFEFRPVFKACITGNDMPYIAGTDEGIWRRVLIVPWSVKIPVAEQLPFGEVLKMYETERSGILNWLLEGCQIYLEEGLEQHIPEAVKLTTEDYRDSMDPLGRFIDDCIVKTEPDEHGKPLYKVRARDMYNAYLRWCREEPVKPWNETSFGKELPKRGYEKARGRIRQYLNVELHNVPEDEPLPPDTGGRR